MAQDNHRFQPLSAQVRHSGAPSRCKTDLPALERPGATLIMPQRLREFLDGPGPGGFQGALLELLELLLMPRRHMLPIGQPDILGSRERIHSLFP